MENVPLAERMRPRTLAEFRGQSHLLDEGKIVANIVATKEPFSLILWGPPGCGKTTLAYLIAKSTDCIFVPLSAVTSGIKEVKDVIEKARDTLNVFKQRTMLFIDEIHRFNKAQQDAFLPHVEKGIVVLVGATTENPSFEVIPPLLSRCKVLVLEPLSADDILSILKEALGDKERGLGKLDLKVSGDDLKLIAGLADGDARFALNAIEIAVSMAGERAKKSKAGGTLVIDRDIVKEAVQQKALIYDKDREEHYNIISALHKAVRGSDPDAALYWLARMLEAGEDPLYVARRVVRMATEDIGLADPFALTLAISAQQAVHFIGMPEGALALAEAVVYMAAADKSNSVYTAYGRAQAEVTESGSLPVPLHIRNAPTRLMKELSYGKGYKYAHEFDDAFVYQTYLPEKLAGKKFYRPNERGFEKKIAERLKKWWDEFKKKQGS